MEAKDTYKLDLTLTLATYEIGEGRQHTRIESVKAGGDEIGMYLTHRLLMMMTDYANMRSAETKLDWKAAINEPSKEKGKPKPGFVYVMKDTIRNVHKIGYSKNPEQRERTLQSEVPSIEKIAQYNGSTADEKALHIRFAEKRLRGEWFNLDESDLAQIEQYFNSAAQ